MTAGPAPARQAPQSVCWTFSTFVCNNCSGVLCVVRAVRGVERDVRFLWRPAHRPCRSRELNFRVGGISMTAWDEKKVQQFKEGGNKVRRRRTQLLDHPHAGTAREQAAAAKWLATWDPDTHPKPKQGDRDAIRQFMIQKYQKQACVAVRSLRRP